MYCTNCHREWKPRTKFCVLCGRELIERSIEERQLELQHVAWLIDEITRWDRYSVGPTLRQQLTQQYIARHEILKSALTPECESEEVVPVAAAEVEPAPPVQSHPSQVEAAPETEAEPEPESAEAPDTDLDEDDETEPNPLFTQPTPTADDRVVAAASTWNRIWKPFLSESVGWFIGGFLILAGTLSLVGNAWGSLSDDARALTVFGFAGGWTLAFVTWARFLLRREHTKGAGVVLERIAAIIAPLATVAVGPVRQSPLLFWPVVVGWSLVAAWLARAATRRVDERATLPTALAIGLATVMMGAAPLLDPLGANAIWFSLVPVVLCAFALSGGPRETPQATWFVGGAMLYATALFVIRVDVAMRAAGIAPSAATYAPMIALLASCALWLRPQTGRAADVWSVAVVSAQAVLLVPAFIGQAPAFVIAALVAAWTSGRLALERVSKQSARWVVPAYVFAYLAFQHVDQLVPGYVTELFNALKHQLGYDTRPMPASYVSVYAAIFVVVIGVFAAIRFAREQASRHAEADMLLWCTAVASVVFGGMAVMSLGSDPRPAIVAAPLLMTLGLTLGFGLNRRELTVSGSLLAVATGVSYGWWLHSPWPLGVVALGLAGLSIFATQHHRNALSYSALALALGAMLASWVGPPSFGQPIAMALASVAALLVARNLDDRTLLSLAWSFPLMLVARSAEWLAPHDAPLVLALAALVGAFASRAANRFETLWVPSSLAALLAVVWGLSIDAGPLLGGLEVPIAAAALLVGAVLERRRADAMAFEALGLLTVVLALVPPLDGFTAAFAWLTPQMSTAACLAVALGCSVQSVRAGRKWQSVLLASLVSALSMLNVIAAVGVFSSGAAGNVAMMMRVGVGLVLLASTPALLASVTVPIAGLFFAMATGQKVDALLAVATGLSAVALAEELDFSWKYLLNRSRVAWAASLSAACILPLVIEHGTAPVMAFTLALPLVWVRATRSTVLSGLALLFTGALASQLDHGFLFVPPIAALVLSRLTAFAPVRDLLKRTEPTLGVSFLLGALATAFASIALASFKDLGPELAMTWVVALLLMRDNALPARLFAAAVALLAVPVAWPAAALVLAAIAFALHHGEGRAAKLFGADSNSYGVISAVAGSVMLASAAVLNHGGAVDIAVLSVAVLSAAVLLDWAPAVAVAIAVLGLNLHDLVHLGLDGGHLGHGPILTPFAMPVALIAAVLAAALRVTSLGAPFESAWARLSRRGQPQLATPVWVGALIIALASLATSSPAWLLVIPLLLLTPSPTEAGIALTLGAVMVVLSVPHEIAGLTFALSGAVMAWSAVYFEKHFPVLRVWHHAGWVLSLVALAFCVDLHSQHLAEVWALMALTMWAVAKRSPKLEFIGFSGTLAAAHAVMAHVGVALSTGAPAELILPWFSLASVLVAAWPVARASSNQRRVFGLLASGLSLIELAAALMTIDSPHPREAIVGFIAAGLGACLLAYRAWQEDDAIAALLGQIAVIGGVVIVNHVGLGHAIGSTETWACIVFGMVLSELATRSDDQVASALRAGAFFWPMVGLAALVGQPAQFISLVLMALAAHFAIMARSEAVRGRAAIAAAVAFNAAMVFGYQASGWDGPQYLAIPFGVSMLTLVWVFKESLDVRTAARLRAIAIAIIYGAAAWSPLTFDASWALWLCVLICVIGVAAGIVLRIRSYVFLGTAFLVTSVVANLVRYGIRDPRAGAIFLSGLGLLVVGFMVLVTTRRAELLARYRSVQQLLARWEG